MNPSAAAHHNSKNVCILTHTEYLYMRAYNPLAICAVAAGLLRCQLNCTCTTCNAPGISTIYNIQLYTIIYSVDLFEFKINKEDAPTQRARTVLLIYPHAVARSQR